MAISHTLTTINVDDRISTYNPFYAVSPHRSNVVLQMLLLTNCYISFIWSIGHLINMIICVSDLYNSNGAVTVAAFIVAVLTEMARLYAGYSINLRTRASYQWLVLTLTPCILLPAMVYLRLINLGQVLYLSILSNALFAIIALEILVAILHFVCCKPADTMNWNANDHPNDNNSMDLNANGNTLTGSQEQSHIRRRLASKSNDS